jgi:hypothetical protein
MKEEGMRQVKGNRKQGGSRDAEEMEKGGRRSAGEGQAGGRQER